MIIVAQHALIAQKAQRKVFRVIANGHRGHDFLGIEVDRQRAFLDHADGRFKTVVIDATHRTCQARCLRIGRDQIFALVRWLGQL